VCKAARQHTIVRLKLVSCAPVVEVSVCVFKAARQHTIVRLKLVSCAPVVEVSVCV